mmetsp:Transcript_32103/g.47287  ORF Transcript_32103/g.47287 Transcript_32103/m.47287 type:complete len:95 (-) Transcript_32103:557-841(-)
MKTEKYSKPMHIKVTIYWYHYLQFLVFYPRSHYLGLSMRGVAAAAARIMAGVELFLLLLPTRTRIFGVGVYAVRKADPNESLDLALLFLEPLEG